MPDKTGMSVKIEDHTAEIKDALEQAQEVALQAIGEAAVGFAQRNTPVGTPESTGIPGYIGGTLRQSITYATAHKGGKTISIDGEGDPGLPMHGGSEEPVPPGGEPDTVYIGTNVYYAPYVEYGHHSYEPRHMLKRAIEDHHAFYRKIWKSTLEGK